MLSGRARVFWMVLLVAVLTALVPSGARAALPRPNALDRRIDGIAAARLLREPASALVDPDRQNAAARFARWTLPGWLASILAQALLLWYFWRFGHAARLRDWLRRRCGTEWLTRFAFGAALAVVANLASLIPDFYLYRVDRRMDITTELSRSWGLSWIVNTIVAMIAIGAIVALVLWLVERTHQWYIYTAAGIVAASVAVAYLAPFGIAVTPRFVLPARLSQAIANAERSAGEPDIPVVVQRAAAGADTARALGMGDSRRLVLPSTMLAGETPPETLFIAASELGAFAHDDPLRRALHDALLIVLGAAFAVFIADRVGFRRDDDELSRMALVGALLACAYLIVMPFDLSMARSASLANDAYAVSLTRDPASAVREIVRSTDQRLISICPTMLQRVFLNRTPSPGQRVARINGIADGCP